MNQFPAKPCARCDCPACSPGYENHEHRCTGDAGCIEAPGFGAGAPDAASAAPVGDDAAKGAALLKLCREFVAKQRIGCAEDVYQTDHVIVNGYGLIEDICEVVGYHQGD